ncbi:uncharacterized protein LOC109718547 isoform X2 [Ananas comosus]|uniref:Uncharacterized protein LOC109718547 isoform X2 n=1 Tax=Ananas comosus TaxID=4615 RepID=A0A6P5G3V2_ANACO|nr:uncharacterized protein LOC109718547 isoform X2 [Ananas comosus]
MAHFLSLSPSSLPPLPHLKLAPKLLHPLPIPPLSKALNSNPNPNRPGRSISASASPEGIGALEKEPAPLTPPSPSPSPEELGVAESVAMLKAAAKTRRVPAAQVLAALAEIKKAKADPSGFFETLGGSESPGRTWMLIFTAQGGLEKGRYFPVTAVQRFDAAAKRIENGIYLGPIGYLTFEGNLSWKNRILAFIFKYINVKIGPFNSIQIRLNKEEREPTTKDPFFVWFYVDEEIAVAQGRGGGIAFWCRCRRIT